jgi:hypothetical protein
MHYNTLSVRAIAHENRRYGRGAHAAARRDISERIEKATLHHISRRAEAGMPA